MLDLKTLQVCNLIIFKFQHMQNHYKYAVTIYTGKLGSILADGLQKPSLSGQFQ